MNANPSTRTRFPSRRPPLRRAAARRSRPGGRRNGEWIRGGQNLPACYATNVAPVVEARFSVEPDAVTNCGLRATGGPFGGIAATNIAFSGGDSGVVRLSMSGTTGSLVGRYGYDLVWMCDSLDADTFPEEGFAETTNLVAYTIFREPLSPWTNEWTNVQNAWTNALEFALATAGAGGSDSETNALAAITRHLFSGHGLRYASAYGGIPGYMSGKSSGSFALSSYMNKSGPIIVPRIKRAANMVNCYDQAAGVHVLGSVVGIKQSYVFMEPFGYLNEIDLIGIGPCNNPFFPESSPSLAHCGDNDTTIREPFGNHAFVSCDGFVFDACAGPATGNYTHASYIATVIDRSTPQELLVAGSNVTTGAVTRVY